MTKTLAKCELCEKEHPGEPVYTDYITPPDECPFYEEQSMEVSHWNRLQAAIKKAKDGAYGKGVNDGFNGRVEASR